MEITVDLLKSIALAVYDRVNPLLGTKQAAEKLQKGAGGDISMHIDVLAENLIIDLLKENNANVLFISEEIGHQYIGDKKIIEINRNKLIVDPIDGSNNAVRGIPYSSVSIAFAKGDKIKDIEIGVVINLNTRDLFWAVKGQGAYMNNNRISVSDTDLNQKSFFEIDISKRNFFQHIDKFKNILSKSSKIRIMGSTALTLCQIARGSMDTFLNFRESSRVVDAAAGYLILMEAGGKIFSINGLEIDQKLLSIETRFPFVACNSKLEEYLKKEVVF